MLPAEAKLIVVDMIYNMGEAKKPTETKRRTGVNGFADMVSEFEWRDWDGVAREMVDSNWYTETGRRAKHHISTMQKLHTEQWYMQAYNTIRAKFDTK